MSDPNPYASPRCAADAASPVVAVVVAKIGAWRQGDYLVMHRAADLPLYCFSTGEPTTAHLEFEFSSPGDRYQLRLALGVHQALLHLPVSEAYRANYNWKTRLLFLSIVAGIGLAFGIVFTIRFSPLLAAICGIGSVLSFIVAGIATLLRPTPALYDIDASYVWLRGASPEFLCHLPEWPFGPG